MISSVHLSARTAPSKIDDAGSARVAENGGTATRQGRTGARSSLGAKTNYESATGDKPGESGSRSGYMPGYRPDAQLGSAVADASGSNDDADSSSEQDAPHGSSFHAVLNQYWESRAGDASDSGQSVASRSNALSRSGAVPKVERAGVTSAAAASSTSTSKSDQSTAYGPDAQLVSAGADESRADGTSSRTTSQSDPNPARTSLSSTLGYKSGPGYESGLSGSQPLYARELRPDVRFSSTVGSASEAGADAVSSQDGVYRNSGLHAVLNQDWQPRTSDELNPGQSSRSRSAPLSPSAAFSKMGSVGGAPAPKTNSASRGESERSIVRSPLGSTPGYKSGPAYKFGQSGSQPGYMGGGRDVQVDSAAGGRSGSSAPASPLQEDASRSSAGLRSVLHQHSLPPEGDPSDSSSGAGGQDTAPPVPTNADATQTVAARAHPVENTHGPLSSLLSIPSAQDSSAQDLAPHEAARNRAAYDVPVSDPSSLVPSNATLYAASAPDNTVPAPSSAAQNTTDSSPSSALATPKGSGSGQRAEDDLALTPDELTNASPVAHGGELAFAARLTPREILTDSAASDRSGQNPPVADPSVQDVSEPTGQFARRAQASAQPTEKQTEISPAAATPSSPSEVQSKARVTELEQFAGQGGAAWENIQPAQAQQGQAEPANPARSETEAASASPAVRMEQHLDPPQAPAGSSHDITVRVPDATERGASIRFVDRGGEVRVSVRTGDAELAQTLRSGLPDFVGRLDHTGIRAEVWRPAASPHSDAQSDSQNDSRNGSQNPQGNQNGSGRNPSGSQGREDARHNTNKPRWVEELETSIGMPTTPANQ